MAFVGNSKRICNVRRSGFAHPEWGAVKQYLAMLGKRAA